MLLGETVFLVMDNLFKVEISRVYLFYLFFDLDLLAKKPQPGTTKAHLLHINFYERFCEAWNVDADAASATCESFYFYLFEMSKCDFESFNVIEQSIHLKKKIASQWTAL